MRQLIFLGYICLLAACGNNQAAKPEAEKRETPAPATNTATETAVHPIAGNWVGYLGDNRLNVQIQTVTGKQVNGRSVAAGNFRAVTGTIEETPEGYKLQLKEPGDDKYDGEFTITIKKSGMVCEGNWQPFDKGLKAKPFTLAKKEFAYQPGAGLYPEASERLLKEEDVANYIKSDLRLMRNSIYARHGYSFKMKDMRNEFDKQDWYMPMSTDVRNNLTEIEKKNEALIKRYEKYAAEFYDDFGR
jgi:YARHG domain